ncbi:MAG: metallopeptidase family protein [Vallitaleaceae bacterium]|nr:metallopeptidase family protein [Vallitaleaceae bacterium]
MKLEAFMDYVTYVAEKEIPSILLRDLNMGIQVNPKKQEDDEERDYYIMGEYIQDELGCGVVLYYGSFRYFLEDDSKETWQKEIMDTIKHELIHHVEAMAGQEDLALQEDLDVLQRKKSKMKKSSKK